VNAFVDAICVPATALNKAAAELYINFMLSPEIALANAEHIYYASPNTAVLANDDYSLKGDEILYPEDALMPKSEIFSNLPDSTLNLMSSLWDEVKTYVGDSTSAEESDNTDSKTALNSNEKTIIGLSAFAGIAVLYLIYRTVQKKKRENA
jgi:spermidine/putrescine-binding protein